jgi:hypothetical protein
VPACVQRKWAGRHAGAQWRVSVSLGTQGAGGLTGGVGPVSDAAAAVGLGVSCVRLWLAFDRAGGYALLKQGLRGVGALSYSTLDGDMKQRGLSHQGSAVVRVVPHWGHAD